jgi:hypothetical protein
MVQENKIEAIEPVYAGKGDELLQPVERVAPKKEQFESLMQQERPLAMPAGSNASRGSLMEAVREFHGPIDSSSPSSSANALVLQTKDAVQQIEEIKQILATPQANIKSSARQLLHNKLSHIDESLRIALTKAGVEYNTIDNAPPTTNRANPIERFIALLTQGQGQLQTLGTELKIIADSDKEISPASMMAIQVKVGQIQQEIELFTSLLNKGLESIKTIMNVQV